MRSRHPLPKPIGDGSNAARAALSLAEAVGGSIGKPRLTFNRIRDARLHECIPNIVLGKPSLHRSYARIPGLSRNANALHGVRGAHSPLSFRA